MALVLSDDPIEQVNQILREIPQVNLSVSSFEAFYLIVGIQTLLSHPKFCDRDLIPAQRVEAIARRVQPNISKHPILRDILANGWTAVERIQEQKAKAKLTEQTTLPSSRKELNAVAKAAKIQRFSSMRKTELIEALQGLPSDKLIAAIQSANSSRLNARAS